MKKSVAAPGREPVPVALALLMLLILALGASSCGNLTDTSSTQDTGALYTEAAQTLLADLTLQAGNTAVARLTDMARTPTTQPPTLTFTPEPSATLSPPTPTSVPPSPTPTPLRCDWAEFLGDVTVPDNTSFPPGADFSKVWRVRNIGSCTWSTNYDLVFTGGDAMGQVRSVPLPGIVRPGETVDLSVDLRAPASQGNYRGEWMLRNPSGNVFGISANAVEAFWVQVQVQQASTSNLYAYDFVASYCLADWSNGSQRLSCPGTTSDQAGFVVRLDRPELENRVENEPALWTRPASGRDGWIVGEYPPYLVKRGDHFLTEIGCLYDNSDCNLRFQLDYRSSNGVVRNLETWKEVYDSTTTNVDLDLSSLEGNSVQFILSVNNLGNYRDANAFWFVPHIRNRVEINQVALRWRQTQTNVCNQLEIYLSSRNSATANAYFCLVRSEYLGSTTLTENEVEQMVGFYDRLNSFSAEVYTANVAVLNYLDFNGTGGFDASKAEIELLSSLAERLFNRIAR